MRALFPTLFIHEKRARLLGTRLSGTCTIFTLIRPHIFRSAVVDASNVGENGRDISVSCCVNGRTGDIDDWLIDAPMPRRGNTWWMDLIVKSWIDRIGQVFNRNDFKSLIGLLINVTCEAVLWCGWSIKHFWLSNRTFVKSWIDRIRQVFNRNDFKGWIGFINKCYW